RDFHVTGVQTCALPISLPRRLRLPAVARGRRRVRQRAVAMVDGPGQRRRCRPRRHDRRTGAPAARPGRSRRAAQAPPTPAPPRRAARSRMTHPPVRAYVGLGANLGDSLATLRGVIDELAITPGIAHCLASPFYRSAPFDAAGPDFINAVAALDTTLG